MVKRTLLKETQDLPHGTAKGTKFHKPFDLIKKHYYILPLDVEAIIRKEWEPNHVVKGGYTKKELDVFDESLTPGETVQKLKSKFETTL